MPLFRPTPARLFWATHTEKRRAHPLRRWLYNWLFLGVVVAGSTYVGVQYQIAKWDAARVPGGGSGTRICTPAMMELLQALPLNYVSNLMGQLAEAGPLPQWVHAAVIDWMVRHYDVDLSDSAADNFESVQDFYTRAWRPGARPADPSALLVAPCDGVVQRVEERVEGGTLTQVKGVTYTAQALFRAMPQAPPRKARKRVAVVLHLRVRDYHHVVAPCEATLDRSIYVPGYLLPITDAALSWIPGVLTANERLVVGGTVTGTRDPLRIALVGGTLNGRIALAFDRRVRTNFLDPPDYDVVTRYKPQVLARGAEIGHFRWGSSVVLMVDVPDNARFTVQPGDTVKAGQPILDLPRNRRGFWPSSWF